jgi:predicted acyltransferase
LKFSAFLFAAPSDWHQPGGLDFFCFFFLSRKKRKWSVLYSNTIPNLIDINVKDNMQGNEIKDTVIDQRLYSLDALRGFDMFWIIGADEVFHELAKSTDNPFWVSVSTQFTHPSWNGFHFYDLIFPLFLFLAGVSTPYSIGRSLSEGKTKHQLLLRVTKRGLILVLLGLIYNNGLQLRPIADIRFSSVLGRIGIAYMLANIIYLYAKEKMQIVWFFGLLIGYWLILKFTSAPGFAMGDLTMEGNFASYMDRSIYPANYR